MKISEMCNALEEIKRQNGDIDVYCGQLPIGGFAVLPENVALPNHTAHPLRKIVSILTKTTRWGF